MRTLLWPVALAGALGLLPGSAHAQRFGSAEIDRIYSPGAKVPYDGAPWTYRYNYQTGGIIYLNGSSSSLYYADYLDRFNRALKFGYPIPRDPALAHQPPRQLADGTIVIDPADPNTDPADILARPKPRRFGWFR
jgi:hypothetical protein